MRARIKLPDAIDDLYRKTCVDGATTSTQRLKVLAEYCVQELAARGLPGAQIDPEIPGFARAKDWDVAWLHRGKVRLAVSLKSLLRNLGGAVPNRLDELIGEVANLQLYSPEVVVGYVMVLNVAEDERSKKHGCTWAELLRARLQSLAGRRAPHWTVGTIEALAFVEVDFRERALLRSEGPTMAQMFDTLIEQVLQRNPDLGGAR